MSVSTLNAAHNIVLSDIMHGQLPPVTSGEGLPTLIMACLVETCSSSMTRHRAWLGSGELNASVHIRYCKQFGFRSSPLAQDIQHLPVNPVPVPEDHLQDARASQGDVKLIVDRPCDLRPR
jgi:hypothetical protein